MWLYPRFEDGWVLTHEIAAAIRTIRRMRALAYEDLADVTVRRSISSLEQAQVNVSVNKLAELANALNFDFVALLAICVALRDDQSPDEILKRASSAVAAFSIEGGMAHLHSQLFDGKVISRSPGKPANVRNMAAVAQLRAQGLKQTEICKTLGLSKSTVNRYWNLPAAKPE